MEPGSPLFVARLDGDCVVRVTPRGTMQESSTFLALMLQALDDKWTSYYTPGDFASFQDVLGGEYTGVGVWDGKTWDFPAALRFEIKGGVCRGVQCSDRILTSAVETALRSERNADRVGMVIIGTIVPS